MGCGGRNVVLTILYSNLCNFCMKMLRIYGKRTYKLYRPRSINMKPYKLYETKRMIKHAGYNLLYRLAWALRYLKHFICLWHFSSFVNWLFECKCAAFNLDIFRHENSSVLRNVSVRYLFTAYTFYSLYTILWKLDICISFVL